ncbi:MAG TPA: aminomethyl transferase family protein [Verrucomicrobiota bacterium]|jgi:folate-binding protein YgfZ|nr:aminomethyl transferase family protein [Verrucomicrobiota bacterium]
MPADSLHAYLNQQGAQFGNVAGEQVAQNYGDTNAEYKALRESVALVDLSSRGCLAVLGDDRVKFINGQVTNDIAGLRPGQGCYAALVNAKARMQADLHVYRLDDELILDFEPGLLDTVTQRLESHIVADQIELVDASPHFGLLSLQGPKTVDALAALGLLLPEKLFAHIKSTIEDWGEVYAMNNGRYGAAGCDLYIPSGDLAKAAGCLLKAVVEQGGRLAGWKATEIVRVEAGIPRFGIDMDANTLPPEVALEKRAISYTKGCYIGQEIMARIRTYGRLNRTLVGYRLDADLAPGTQLTDDSGKTVGTLASVIESPRFGPIALGLAKRGSDPIGQVFTAREPAQGRATVVRIPFC